MSSVKQFVKDLLPQAFVSWYLAREAEASLSVLAKAVREENYQGLPEFDCGPSEAVRLSMNWLCQAQDNSASNDGGVARHFSLNSGWSPSYPETTGYIVPTFLQLADEQDNDEYRSRAERMLEWFVDIQLDSGAFQGGMIGHDVVPVTFNTGQILLGLAAGAKHLQKEPYVQAMNRAAIWLRDSLDDDGCWRRFGTPFAKAGEKTYETHVAWGLLEADRVAPGQGYGDAGLRQIRWAAANVQNNGWIKDCCLSDVDHPLTHTLGYALRGFVEGYRFSNDPQLLAVSEKIAGGLMSAVGDDGRLPGRLDRDLQAAVSWVCLTGAVQIAASLFDLFEMTGREDYRAAGKRLNAFVRHTLVVDGVAGRVGAVGGSFPIDGLYGEWEYLNWAAKFMIDAQLLELKLQS